MQTVLLVDDEIPMLEAVSGMFASHGWDVVPSRNGTDAVARAGERQFDVVVSDVVMEGLVGTALLDEIRAVAGADMPVLFVSNMPEPRVRGIIHGEFGFLRKPFRADDLMRAVGAMVRATEPETGGIPPPNGHDDPSYGRRAR